ncbi:hypothetical protein Acsp06_47050 [Actinomycetospora sp. NBRC 106375]|uniref:glycosyltransferase family 4 protein n=1 Tax=Actinomycetospora sp. NBRC 106375 TaxID=3032207 RepID=UPI0024A287DE|nr:glycosyltransferase family 4 protein [Actinomycetospora sp. NBRC 106375]GLZ48520.1 hypothetical protein Acsp06_47050 [Actinomycetospora sp. NBRC 106375]
MRFLILTSRRIESRLSGYDLRVANLCTFLPGEVHLVIAPLEPLDRDAGGLDPDDVFDSVEELEPLATERRLLRRHVRTSNTHYVELTHPTGFARARARLHGIVRTLGITHVVVFGGEAAELAATLSGPVLALDVCDSATLTAERARAGAQHRRCALERLHSVLDIARKRRTERLFARRFDLVTTINDADSRAVGGARHREVLTVPNGLDEAYVRPLPAPGSRRGVVFWGNQAFDPNRDALRFFVEDVYLPRLRDSDVELCVVGSDPPAWLESLAADEPSIVLTGYVDDLPAVVDRYPIMINPMQTGSGLKNKVLEAFGLGLAVVSTTLGVEAVPQARHGEHLVCADDGDEFARAILRLLDDPGLRERLRRAAHELVARHYRWESIGHRWSSLIAGHPSRVPAHRTAETVVPAVRTAGTTLLDGQAGRRAPSRVPAS